MAENQYPDSLMIYTNNYKLKSESMEKQQPQDEGKIIRFEHTEVEVIDREYKFK